MPSLDPALLQQAGQFFGVLGPDGRLSNDNASRVVEALTQNPGLMDAVMTGEGFAGAGGAQLPPAGVATNAPAGGGGDDFVNQILAQEMQPQVQAMPQPKPEVPVAPAGGVGAGAGAPIAVDGAGNTLGAGAELPPNAIDPGMITGLPDPSAMVGSVEPTTPAPAATGASPITGANLNFGTMGEPINPMQLLMKGYNSGDALVEALLGQLLSTSSAEQTPGRGNPRGLGAGQ